MAPYIGTATSRVDGFAKVTGAAKYAAELNVPGLANASLVCSTIAKGRILGIDASAATRLKGVLTVLTHENRPPMADNDQAYKDDVAPDGSPFRPLYDNKVMFNGQPIALVVAETSEVARHAASLVRVEYAQEAHVTDVYRQRDAQQKALLHCIPPSGHTTPDGTSIPSCLCRSRRCPRYRRGTTRSKAFQSALAESIYIPERERSQEGFGINRLKSPIWCVACPLGATRCRTELRQG